jgi:hypothetical protein
MNPRRMPLNEMLSSLAIDFIVILYFWLHIVSSNVSHIGWCTTDSCDLAIDLYLGLGPSWIQSGCHRKDGEFACGWFNVICNPFIDLQGSLLDSRWTYVQIKVNCKITRVRGAPTNVANIGGKYVKSKIWNHDEINRKRTQHLIQWHPPWIHYGSRPKYGSHHSMRFTLEETTHMQTNQN